MNSLLVISGLLFGVRAQFNTHHLPGKSGIVHLFEWKWKDIAKECERFLAPIGYAAVQTSPANENAYITGRHWWDRYQPVSYKLQTRSGNEVEFADMVKRCNAVGIRIYVDVVFNHMASKLASGGVAGSQADPGQLNFPDVPYGPLDFNTDCTINNYADPINVRNCRLGDLPDLNQGVPWVRERIAEYLNYLLELGVAGFRVDAAKHMWVEDLKLIYMALNNLNTEHGFPTGSRPFIYQEVIDMGYEVIKKEHYTHLGAVTEFRFSYDIGRVFHGAVQLRYLSNWGQDWGFLPSNVSLVFIDNHDNQRGHGGGSENILTHKESRQYRMSTAFMLAHPYGIPCVMSSFAFTDRDQGPPHDFNDETISPTINTENLCENGWICEHRWKQIYEMVRFRNAVTNTGLNDWWSNGYNQIAFCRGGKGFIAFNNQDTDFNARLQTCLPKGDYCDVISGSNAGNTCTGVLIKVEDMGFANIFLAGNGPDGVLAIHVKSKLKTF